MTQIRWSTFGPVLVRIAISLAKQTGDKKLAGTLTKALAIQEAGENIDAEMVEALRTWKVKGAPSVKEIDEKTKSVQSRIDKPKPSG